MCVCMYLSDVQLVDVSVGIINNNESIFPLTCSKLSGHLVETVRDKQAYYVYAHALSVVSKPLLLCLSIKVRILRIDNATGLDKTI